MRLGRFLAVAAAVVLLAPAVAVAQSSIAGTVTDDTGGVLPGVTVEASSDVLIEGSRVVFTDGTGNYNIIDLRPGVYSVVFTLPGFGTQVRDQLILAADVALPVDVQMSVGSVEETITVSGETPVVDVQQVQRIEVMTRETQESIPTGRSMWSYALLIPGVKVHKPDVGGTAGVQQSEMMGRGLDAAHTTIEVDGMMINTMISDGRYQAYLNPMLAAETSYTTAGQGAETQNGGLRINMIPNEGGNQFSGNWFTGFTPGNWQADNLGVMGDGRAANQFAYDQGLRQATGVSLIYDNNGAIGGPVFRDRLWFFSTGRWNGVNNEITNSVTPDYQQGLDNNTIHSANVRLTWQMTQQHKISAMFDKVRKRRFSQHDPGTDLVTASSSWTSPHYDTGTAKWTGTLSNRMLAEFGFSLIYEDWDPGYYRYRDDGQLIFQDKPDAASLATCYETPCYPEVGSARHMAQLSPAMGGDPWYTQVPIRDGRLGMLYGAKDGGENNNYTHRWAYQSAVSYVTGSHSFKVGMNFSRGRNRHTTNSNGNLRLTYDDGANPQGSLIQDSPIPVGALTWFNCEHPYAVANVDAGTTQGGCGLLGTPDNVRIYNHPSNLTYQLDYNGGVYAQDSWTIDRLTLNYGMRVDFASVSVPEAPKGSGRFVPAQLQPSRGGAGDPMPKWGPDISPRLSVAYDVFGDARTALKFGWNKYVRDVGGEIIRRYPYGASGSDDRDWFDCHIRDIGGGTGECTGLDPYGSNYDGIAQNWEIGPSGSTTFGSILDPTRSPDLNNFAREYNRIWTVGIQQEIIPGLSMSGEYRQRTYHNTWGSDNPNWTFDNFTSFEIARPYPYAGSITAYSIDPSLRTSTSGIVDRTRGPGYSNVYKGFELSIQGRLAGGGTLFGGWSMEDTGRTSIYTYDRWGGGGSRYGGEVNNCSDILERGDEPNWQRFCDAGAYPRPFRNEFKLSGTQPFSLPLFGDLQLGASLQAYPGGLGDWGGLQEGMFVHRSSTNDLYRTYSPEFYGQAGQCVAPCMLGGAIIPDGFTTVARSSTSNYFPMIPINSVKFQPYWTQLDVNVQKVFNIGSWRYDARFSFYNALNNGVTLDHGGSRNARGSTGATYQALSQWERANRMLEGRVIQFAVTARF